MLHGYLSSKESFIHQIRFFSRFRRVVAIDMQGFGKSEELPYPYSVDDYADEVASVLDRLGEKKVDVLAHSFGARVAVKLAERDNRIDKIIFTGAAGLKPKRGVKYLLRRASFLFLKLFIKREKLKFLYSEDYRNLSEVKKQSFKKIVGEHLDGYYKKLNNDCLIVFGSRDKQTPLSYAKRMKKLIKNSRLVVLNGLGHFCFSEDPEGFNGVVFGFLSECNNLGCK